MKKKKRDTTSAAERWKRFAAAADLEIPDEEIEAITPTLDRITAATRQALEPDLGFMGPAFCFRLPGEES